MTATATMAARTGHHHHHHHVRVFDGFATSLRPTPRRASATLTETDGLWLSAVDPRHRFVLVTPYKVASSELHILFYRLMGDPDWNDAFYKLDGRYRRSPEGCAWALGNPYTGKFVNPYAVMDNFEPCGSKSFRKLTLQEFPPFEVNASAMMSSPRWKRAIIVRHPLDRFQSAFVDKCIMAPLKVMVIIMKCLNHPHYSFIHSFIHSFIRSFVHCHPSTFENRTTTHSLTPQAPGHSPLHCPIRDLPAEEWRNQSRYVDNLFTEWTAALTNDADRAKVKIYMHACILRRRSIHSVIQILVHCITTPMLYYIPRSNNITSNIIYPK